MCFQKTCDLRANWTSWQVQKTLQATAHTKSTVMILILRSVHEISESRQTMNNIMLRKVGAGVGRPPVGLHLLCSQPSMNTRQQWPPYDPMLLFLEDDSKQQIRNRYMDKIKNEHRNKNRAAAHGDLRSKVQVPQKVTWELGCCLYYWDYWDYQDSRMQK